MGQTPAKMRVDHVGIAVESIETAEPLLLALGCEKLLEEPVESADFTWAYFELGDASRLELIEPHDGTESFLTRFLAENGPGLHHVTLEVASLDDAVETVQDAGFDVVDRSEMDGYSEAFISPRNPTGAIFQLMEYHQSYADEHGEEIFIQDAPLVASDD